MKGKILIISSILLVLMLIFSTGITGCAEEEEPVVEPAAPAVPAEKPAPTPPAEKPAPPVEKPAPPVEKAAPPAEPPPVPEPETEPISWDEAANNIGVTTSVCGKIFGGDVYSPPNMTLLMGGPLMVGIAIEVVAGTFDEDPVGLFDGKYVCVTGTITPDFFGGPSILVNNAAQIVIEPEPEVAPEVVEVIRVTWEEAVDYIGEEITVCGPIIDAMDIGGPTLLGMGKSGMDPGCVGIEISAVIVADLPGDQYVGQTICVTGPSYQNPLGGASILVTDLSQIVIEGEEAAEEPEPEAGAIPWEEAVNYIGEEMTVCGPIIDAMDIGGPTLLGMGKSGMDPGCVGIEISAVIVADLPGDQYVGQTICVTGPSYQNPFGGASVLVTDLSQIVVQ